MRADSTAPGALIPPPLPDPFATTNPDEHRRDADSFERLGVEWKQYFLYSGNLDGYQEIEVLAQAAALLTRATTAASAAPRLLVASHDPAVRARIDGLPGLDACVVESAEEMLALIRGARACILMRQAEGGYPIKLVNAHAVGTPTIAFRGREWGLVDGRNALLANLDRPGASLAEAILRLRGDDALAEGLGRGARALYLDRHTPERAARDTLALVEEATASKRTRRKTSPLSRSR